MNYEEFKNEFVDALQERLYENGNEVSIRSFMQSRITDRSRQGVVKRLKPKV